VYGASEMGPLTALPQRKNADREKELDGEERESIQGVNVKPVSAGGFMTFQVSQVYSERVAASTS
jgi:hypothetical protein